MEVSDAIAKCRAGDKLAYEEIVAAHADRLVSVLHKLLGNLEDARDIAQETFVRAYLNLHRYDTSRPFEPWLYRIGRNLAYNHLKATGCRPLSVIDSDDSRIAETLPSETKSPVETVLDGERRDEVAKLLLNLRPEFREVLVLRYMERMEYEEIAVRMTIPIGTVKTWLNRAKEQFRKYAVRSEVLR